MPKTEAVHDVANIILNIRDRLADGRFESISKNRLSAESQVAWARERKIETVKSSYYKFVSSVEELDALIHKYLFQGDCTIVRRLRRVADSQSDHEIISQL